MFSCVQIYDLFHANLCSNLVILNLLFFIFVVQLRDTQKSICKMQSTIEKETNEKNVQVEKAAQLEETLRKLNYAYEDQRTLIRTLESRVAKSKTGNEDEIQEIMAKKEELFKKVEALEVRLENADSAFNREHCLADDLKHQLGKMKKDNENECAKADLEKKMNSTGRYGL